MKTDGGLKLCLGGDYCVKDWDRDPKITMINKDIWCPIKDKMLRPKGYYPGYYTKHTSPPVSDQPEKIQPIPQKESPQQTNNHTMDHYT